MNVWRKILGVNASLLVLEIICFSISIMKYDKFDTFAKVFQMFHVTTSRTITHILITSIIIIPTIFLWKGTKEQKLHQFFCLILNMVGLYFLVWVLMGF